MLARLAVKLRAASVGDASPEEHKDKSVSAALCCRRRSVQVPRGEEPGAGTGPETSGVHVHPGMQRGRNVCTGPKRFSLPHFLLFFLQLASCQNQLRLMPLYSYENIWRFLSAGPVPHANWLLLVCHQ